MFIRINSGAISGIDAVNVTAEVNVASGGIGLYIVGLPDNTIKESHERIQAAFENSGYRLIAKKTVVNLAPADLRKEGSQYDLAIAIGILTATEQIHPTMLDDSMFIGELSLGGAVRPVKGVLPLVAMARKSGFKRVFMPNDNISEGAVVEGIECIGISTLIELCQILEGRIAYSITPHTIVTEEVVEDEYLEDFADVKGQKYVKRALEIAAAGGHNVIMIGSPGSGKTMLARRMPTILPPMTLEEALETTKVHSVAGKIGTNRGLITQRPFRAPHHLTSQVALIGGGQSPQPGEVSLANNGVLFLDEMPEFGRNVLEVLRQPLEDRHITISRAKYSVDYPANFTLIASMNPCPCGYYNHPTKECSCSAAAVHRYMSHISGPLMDRIDIHIEVVPVSISEMTTAERAESSAEIRKRVIAAREIQLRRFEGLDIHCNAMMNSAMLRRFAPLEKGVATLLESAMSRLNLSTRAYDRIIKVARTIADLEGKEHIEPQHITEAIGFRSLDRETWGIR
ncbi:MAG: YifB family Mg chelatase-like AAA ATPase [Alistipes sp.]|nr:YifB family Mg chelatase-like AAA ATPase [Alistipes sp.]